MAAKSNNAPQPTRASSQSTTVLTPSSSGYGSAVSSITGSNTSTSGGQSRGPSPQLLAYLAQPATADGPPYGRLAGQPQAPDPYSRIGFYTVPAQQQIDRFEQAFEPVQQQ